MEQNFITEIIFLVSILFTLYFVFKKPTIKIHSKNRQLTIETFFLGPIFGVVLLFILKNMTINQMFNGIKGQGNLDPLGILVLFLSMVFMSIYLDTTGFFEFSALYAQKRSGNKGRKVFFTFYATISLLTIFTSNDVIIPTFTPFICYFAKRTNMDPKPLLISEFFAANTWSMTLYIGNPTNIILASAFSLKFDQYSLFMIVPSIVAGISNALLLYLVFRKKINQPLISVPEIDPFKAIKDKTGAIIGLSVLSATITMLIIAPYLGIQMWIVSFIFLILLIIIVVVKDLIMIIIKKLHTNRSKNVRVVSMPLISSSASTNVAPITLSNYPSKEQQLFRKNSLIAAFKKMPWGVVPFVLLLFIIVEALRIHNVTADIAKILSYLSGSSLYLSEYVFGIASTFLSIVLNNIPMSVAFVPIINASSIVVKEPIIYATIIGSNLGALITPIGALAGIMWLSILKVQKIKISFQEFMKYGLIVTPITLILSLASLSLMIFLFL